MAHPVDLLVDVGFLLDVGVGARDVGLGLIIVVVGDEVFHRVVGKEVLLIVVDKILRDTHRFGFSSLEDLCEKSEKAIEKALGLIEKYHNAATD